MDLKVLPPVYPTENWDELTESKKFNLVSNNLIKKKKDEQRNNSNKIKKYSN